MEVSSLHSKLVKKEIANFYIFSGEEWYLQKTYIKQIGKIKNMEVKYLDSITGVSLASDAFFPFSDNIERAYASGVTYIAQPGGSLRDQDVIDMCNKLNITMCFTGIRLFHH